MDVAAPCSRSGIGVQCNAVSFVQSCLPFVKGVSVLWTISAGPRSTYVERDALHLA